LRVTSSPAVPTQILVDGQITDSWGLAWLTLPTGTHTVSFTHVEGYSEPPPEAVTINAGTTTTVTGTFTQRGTLRVTTSPAVASEITIDGKPADDWGVWTDLPTGSHQVCFGAVAGYSEPTCQTATITAGGTTTVTGAFAAIPGAAGQTGKGLLRVTTSPAVPAQITLTPQGGSPSIADSWGLNWLELAPGTYTVTFTQVGGYTQPAPQTVTVTAGATTVVTGAYTQRGSLRATTSPAANATITVDGNPMDNWGVWTDLPAGSHQVCFGVTSGGIAPPCQTANVAAGASSTITGVELPSPGTWSNVTSNLANMPSQCGNLTMLSVDQQSSSVIAGVALDGLWSSSDGGTSWSQLGTGTGSDAITNRPSSITYDPAHLGTFWESGIYNSYGVYETTDRGATFHHLGTTTHDDYVSIDFSDPSRKTLLAGGHETAQRVDKSTDGGQTWTNIWGSLPSIIGNSFTQYPIVINSQTYLIDANASWNGGNPGIYRTTDGGTSWTQVSPLGPDVPPLVASDGTIYWSVGGSLAKSSDKGVTWTEVATGLQNITPAQLPDGRLVSASGDSLVVSADGGNSWSRFGAPLPYAPADVVYSPSDAALYISHWDCGSVVLPNAIMRLR
jgi:hypothetical protein